ERRLAEGDRHLADQVLLAALEQRVGADPDRDVEVARRRPRLTGVALAGDLDALPVVEPRRDGDLQRPRDLDLAAAPAGGARVGDLHPLAAAARADHLLLDRQEAHPLDDDALAVAAAARPRPAAGLAAVAGAVAARLGARQRHRLGDAAVRLGQVEFDRHLE